MGRKASRTVVQSSRFVADETRVSLRYSDQTIYAQGASGGAASSLTYAMNGCHICNQTVSAGQPQGWSLLSSQYGMYVVLASRIRWRIAQQPAGFSFGSLGATGALPTNSGLLSAVMYPKNSTSSTATSVKDAAVQLYATPRFDFPFEAKNGGIDQGQGAITNPRSVWRGSRSMSVQKIAGEENLRQTIYEAAVSANPTNTTSWVFLLQDLFADTTYEGVVLVEVDIEYDVILFERKLVTDALVNSGPMQAARMTVVARAGGTDEVKTPSPPETVDRYTFVEVSAPSTPVSHALTAPIPSSARPVQMARVTAPLTVRARA